MDMQDNSRYAFEYDSKSGRGLWNAVLKYCKETNYTPLRLAIIGIEYLEGRYTR